MATKCSHCNGSGWIPRNDGNELHFDPCGHVKMEREYPSNEWFGEALAAVMFLGAIVLIVMVFSLLSV